MQVPGVHFLRILRERHNLLFELVRRDFEQRFVGSAAGWLWALVHPLVLLASWTFVFEWCLRQRLPATEVTGNYTLFLFAGFLPWLLFQDTVTRSANVLLEQKNLLTKTVFPSEILAIAVFLSSLISHSLALLLVIFSVAFFAGHISYWLLLLPIYTVLLGLFAVGVGWIVSSLQVYLRDTAQVLTVLLTFWFWMTPIFISDDQFPPGLRFLVTANPLAYVVRGYRDRILSWRLPEISELAMLAACSVGVFVLGGLFFRHLKRGFADVL